MMLYRRLLLVPLLLCHLCEGAAAESSDPCPYVPDFTAEYHFDSACNKPEQNRFMDSLNKGAQQAWLQRSGIYHVPDKLTLQCPAEAKDLFRHDNSDPIYNYGYSTLWIVHNKASTPVVVSWVDRSKNMHKHDPDKAYYYEVSAVDGSISPPHLDRNAILQPGQWKSIQTYDGHVFYVRRLEPDGSLGPILMQHRVGLIPISNVFGHALEKYCDPNDPDEEPVIVVNDHVERAPEFRRSLRPPLRACNTQDIGFRNLVGCPLNVYYSGLFNMTGKPREPGEECSLTPKSCHEQFKFHLGKNPYSSDFHWGWDSQTKFEGTYVGHNFVFRLMANDDIVVDSVTVEPTYVHDCEDLEANKKDGFRDNVIKREIRVQELIAAQKKTKNETKLRGKPGSDHSDYDDEEF